jgi:hypothetical protein
MPVKVSCLRLDHEVFVALIAKQQVTVVDLGER